MRVVIDANVVAAAVCFQGEAALVFLRLARRAAFAYASEETLAETREVTQRLIRRLRPRHNAGGRLAWYLDQVRLVEPAPLGKPRSRDAKDDPYLAAALAARAEMIVTYDQDLLVLEKPFGISIGRPSLFLSRCRHY